MNNLVVKNLSFSYKPEKIILKEINLVFDTSPTAIIGQNGSGKTTFVKLIKGLLTPISGDIIVRGKNTKEHSVASLAKDIGLIFQNPNDQIFKNTVLDETMFGPLNLKLSKEEAQKNSLQALKLVKLEDRAKDNPYDLSLAERKLITIASIVAMNPKIIIFDEPTIAQDYLGIELIKEIINNLSKAGKLVITITHDMDFVAEIFSRVIVFQQGEVVLDGPTREVFSRFEVLQRAFLEPPHTTQLGRRLGLEKTVLTIKDLVNSLG